MNCRPEIRRERVDIAELWRTCGPSQGAASGTWNCSHGGGPQFVIEIAFFPDGKIAGAGKDGQGDYFITGTWTKDVIKFILQYIGKHKTTYDGTPADGKICGTCFKGDGGPKVKFEMVYCGADDKITPQSGLWMGELYSAEGNHPVQIDFDFGSAPYKNFTGRGKDDSANFRVKGKLSGRTVRLLRHNWVYYGLINSAGTELVGLYVQSGGCWVESKFSLKLSGSGIPAVVTSGTPKSGVWFWFLSGQTSYRCYLELMFVQGTVSGSGRDETGYFTLTGTWSGNTITFTKSTTSITYTGTLSAAANTISGSNPDGGSYDIAFFMEFELPEIPYQFPTKDVINGQQCAIKLYQEIQVWLSRRRRVVEEFRILIQKIEAAQSGSLTAQFPGEIVDVDQLIMVAISLLTLMSGGGLAVSLMSRFGGKDTAISFTSGAYAGASSILEVYKSSADVETLKDLVEDDVLSSRIIYYLIDTMWDIAGVLSTQCRVEMSSQRLVKGFMFQAVTGIDLVSFAFPADESAPLHCAPEFDHGNLGQMEEILMQVIEDIVILNKDAKERVGGSVGIAIKMADVQDALQDLVDGSASVVRKCLERTMDIVEQHMQIYISLQQKTETYFEHRHTCSTKLTVDTNITVEVINETVEVLKEFNPQWCQVVEEQSLQEVFASTMTRVFPAIRQKIDAIRSISPAEDGPGEILEIVVVGQAAVGLPAVNRGQLFPVPTLQDVVLYSPYGCTINQSTILGIASGAIRPNCREASGIDLPSTFNSLLSGQAEEIPAIYLDQTCIDEVALCELNDLLLKFPEDVQRNRVVLPFFTASSSETLPPVPLWLLTSACSVAGMIVGANVRVHLAAGLSVPDPTPELQTLCETQYSYAESSMTCNVAELHLTGINTSWVNQFLQNESLAQCFSSTTSSNQSMTFEGGFIRVTTTTTTYHTSG